MTHNGTISDTNQLSFQELMMNEIWQNFMKCNETVLHKSYPSDGYLYCNATFDGYDCWDYARAGTRTYGTCPDFLKHQFGHHVGLPYKDCNIDGTWYRHPDSDRVWTNYSPCSDTEKVRRAENVLFVYFSGYSLSVVCLVISLLIFTCFRQLKCTRVTIHKHLFISYIITALLWISYYATSSFDPQVYINNPVWCRILHVLAQYATVCNYAWMFCEGFYLHTILVMTFTREKILLIICYLTGWGIPVIPSAIYSGLRSTNPVIDKNCWHKDTYLKYIFSGPIAVSLIVNFIFLINVLRILCSKVRSMNQQESNPIRQSLRATLILIPLLGVQCFAIPLRPDESDEYGQYIYDMISAFLASFQGFLVSLLFCFLNGEVLFLMKNQYVLVRRRISRTETTGKSFIYSAVQQADANANRKKSIQLANQKIYCKSEFTGTTQPQQSEDQHYFLDQTTDV
ncbi:calcitonin gene-related peptide type 1 receptor-like [Mytilus galloprovincialis]|uniref:calcitonin gene-related peptide type 1 receptor-like n=1 Tax=Mytilus galloprovincialis TaxID=29158 RepID=UPI003F7C8C1A